MSTQTQTPKDRGTARLARMSQWHVHAQRVWQQRLAHAGGSRVSGRAPLSTWRPRWKGTTPRRRRSVSLSGGQDGHGGTPVTRCGWRPAGGSGGGSGGVGGQACSCLACSAAQARRAARRAAGCWCGHRSCCCSVPVDTGRPAARQTGARKGTVLPTTAHAARGAGPQTPRCRPHAGLLLDCHPPTYRSPGWGGWIRGCGTIWMIGARSASLPVLIHLVSVKE